MSEICVNVDLDTVADHLQGYGIPSPPGPDVVWTKALGRALRFLEERSIRATFFVIGRDARRHAPELRELVSAGHEVASHSMTHRQPFLGMRSKRRLWEMATSKKMLEEATGEQVFGFKSPGWGMDRESLDLASEAGYVYDASAFPSPLLIALRMMVWWNGNRHRKPLRLADVRQAFGSRLSSVRDTGLVEFPLATTPLLRLPVYNTMRHYLGESGLRFLARRLNPGQSCASFTLHGIDFVDAAQDGVPEGIMRHPGMKERLERRVHGLSALLQVFAEEGYRFVRFKDDARVAKSAASYAPERSGATPAVSGVA